MLDDGVRPSATLFALILSAAVLLFRIFKHRIFGGIARTASLFEVVCFAAFIFALCLPTYLYNVSADKYANLNKADARIEMIVREVYSDTEYYTSFVGDVRAVDLESANFGITVYAPFSAEIKENDIIVFDAHLTDVDEIGLGEARAYYKRNNILFSAEAYADGLFLCLGEYESPLTRMESANRHAGYMLDFRLSPREAALAKALVLGDRSYLPDLLDRDFSRIGISHILALSGMHLTLLIGIYLFFAKRLIKCRTFIRASVIPLTLFILLFTGLSASLLRASLMLIVSYIGLIMKRRPDSLTVLFFILFIIFAVDPYSVFDVGLILSFSSVFGILLLMPYFSAQKLKLLKRMHGGFVVSYVLPFIYDSFTLSFSACAFTLPSMLFFFDYASLIGILSTFLFTPLIVLYIVASLLLFMFYRVPAVCDLISRTICFLYDAIEKLSGSLSSLDNICVSCDDPLFLVGFLTVLIALVLTVLKNSLRAHFAAIMLAAHLAFVLFITVSMLIRANAACVDCISGGNGCSVVATSQGECVIVDLSKGGRSSADITASGVFSSLHTEADTLVMSGYSAKHHLMLKRLNSLIPVKRVLLPLPVSESEGHYAGIIESYAEQNGISLEYFEPGEELNASGLGVTVISSRSAPSSTPDVAVNIECNQQNHLIVGGNFHSGAESEFSRFARLAEAVYLCSGSSVTRTAFRKNVPVFPA